MSIKIEVCWDGSCSFYTELKIILLKFKNTLHLRICGFADPLWSTNCNVHVITEVCLHIEKLRHIIEIAHSFLKPSHSVYYATVLLVWSVLNQIRRFVALSKKLDSLVQMLRKSTHSMKFSWIYYGLILLFGYSEVNKISNLVCLYIWKIPSVNI